MSAHLKKVTEDYLADLSKQLMNLLQTIYDDPSLEKREITEPKEKREPLWLFKGPKIGGNPSYEYAMFKKPEDLHKNILERAHLLKDANRSKKFKDVKNDKLCLDNKKLNYVDGYDERDLRIRTNPLYTELTQTGISYLIIHPEHQEKATRLLYRLSAVAKLHQALEKSQREGLNEQVKTTLETCMKNKPAWSEQPFIDKLKDFLTLGMRYLFFHKDETQRFKENIENVLPRPGIKSR